jgi:hypothetical protein
MFIYIVVTCILHIYVYKLSVVSLTRYLVRDSSCRIDHVVAQLSCASVSLSLSLSHSLTLYRYFFKSF